MASLDTFSIAILLGSLLVLAGILSSLVALRFGAPLLLVFLLLGMLAGEGGPGGLKFDDVGTAYMVGSIALALILFDGGLRTRLATFRNVLAPAATLATAGVLITTVLTAPVAKLALGIGWTQALLVGAVVASTDAAAVFLLINARGLRLRPRVRATLEVESGTNDPFAVFLTLLLVEFLLAGDQTWSHVLVIFLRDTVLGCIIGVAGGRIITLVLNRLALPQGLHAPFVAVSALVVFAAANTVHSSGQIDREKAGRMYGLGGREYDKRAHRHERRMQSLRQSKPVEHQRDDPPAGDADDATQHGIAQEDHQHMRPGLVAGQQELHQQQRKKDRERIVGAGFDFQRRAHARAQPQATRIDQQEHR